MRRRKYRRWVSCFDVKLDEIRQGIEKHGGVHKFAGKPGFCAWTVMVFTGTKEQKDDIDGYFREKSKRYFTRRPAGAFG